MNEYVSKIYDVFLKFTNEFSDRYKEVFINLSDQVDAYKSLDIIEASVESTSTSLVTTYDLKSNDNIPKNILILVKRVLEHEYNAQGYNISISCVINGKNFTVSYIDGKYSYPKEVAKIIKNVNSDLMFRHKFYDAFTIDNTISEDVIIKDIVGTFFTVNSEPIATSQIILKYLSMAAGEDINISNDSAESKELINKQITIENLKKEYADVLKIHQKISSDILDKKELISKTNATRVARGDLDKELETLSADAKELNDFIVSKRNMILKIDEILPAIIDSLRNATLSEDQRKGLTDSRDKLNKDKTSHEILIGESERDLASISSKISILDKEKIKNADPMLDSIGTAVEELKQLADKEAEYSSMLLDLSNNISTLNKSVVVATEKENNNSYISKINFSETSDYLKENYFLNKNQLFVYNFIVFFIKCKLLSIESTADTAKKVYNIIGL